MGSLFGKKKEPKLPELPPPPDKKEYAGSKVIQDGETVADIYRGDDGRLVTMANTPAADKRLQDWRKRQLYTPSTPITRTRNVTPAFNESAARDAYNQYVKSTSSSSSSSQRGSTPKWVDSVNGMLPAGTSIVGAPSYNIFGQLGRGGWHNRGGSTSNNLSGSNSSNSSNNTLSWDAWLADNRQNFMSPSTVTEVIGHTPEGGLEVDFRNMLNRTFGDIEKYEGKRDIADDLVNARISDTDIVDRNFRDELDAAMQARERMAFDTFNRQYKDNVTSVGNDFANRFGTLNSSAFQDNMQRLEDSYNKGAGEIIDRNLLARSNERQMLQNMNQQYLNNLINNRQYYNNSLTGMHNLIGGGLNYFNTGSMPTQQLNGVQAANNAAMMDQQTAAQNYKDQMNYYNMQLGQHGLAQQQANQAGSISPITSAIGGAAALGGLGKTFGPVGVAAGAGLGFLGGLFA